jgi:hypothetical protein
VHQKFKATLCPSSLLWLIRLLACVPLCKVGLEPCECFFVDVEHAARATIAAAVCSLGFEWSQRRRICGNGHNWNQRADAVIVAVAEDASRTCFPIPLWHPSPTGRQPARWRRIRWACCSSSLRGRPARNNRHPAPRGHRRDFRCRRLACRPRLLFPMAAGPHRRAECERIRNSNRHRLQHSFHLSPVLRLKPRQIPPRRWRRNLQRKQLRRMRVRARPQTVIQQLHRIRPRCRHGQWIPDNR